MTGCVCAGLMVILGMFGTFLHCNQVLRNQVALKVKCASTVETFVKDSLNTELGHSFWSQILALKCDNISDWSQNVLYWRFPCACACGPLYQ